MRLRVVSASADMRSKIAGVALLIYPFIRLER
jgi:hypothetical protein